MSDYRGSLLKAAHEAKRAGLNPVPPKGNGSKAPAGRWKDLQKTLASTEQLREWFTDGKAAGLGIVLGEVSGRVEMLEVEGGFADELPELEDRMADAGLDGIWERIRDGYEEATPKGGRHWLLRVSDGSAVGNQKLAADPSGAVKWETRGEGGYVVTAPTNGTVHETGKAWVLLRGGFDSIADITAEERDALYRVIRTMGETPARPDPAPTINERGELGPADRYNADPDIQAKTRELLERHGWEVVSTIGSVDHLRRPAKTDEGHSATLGFHQNPPMLHVFSSNAHPFEPDRAYTPFQVLVILEYGGRKEGEREAGACLAASGYGDPERAPEAAPEELGDPLDLIQPVDFATLRDGLDLEDPWLVEPILPRKRRTSIASAAGVGKSLLALYVAAHLATGRAVLDRPAGEPVTVVYIDAEMSEDDLAERLEDFGFDYWSDSDLQRHLRYYLHPDLPPLDTKDGAELLLRVIERDRPELVIIDTITSQTEGDENEAGTFRRVAALLTSKLTGLGVASLTLDHLGKDAAKGPRGSSGKRDPADCIWILSAPKDSDGFTLKQNKRRQSWIPERVALGFDGGGFKTTGRPRGSKVQECIDDLDALEVPQDASRRQAEKALKEAGKGRRAAVVTDAVWWRKQGGIGLELEDVSHREPPPEPPPRQGWEPPPGTTQGETPKTLDQQGGNHPPEPPGTTFGTHREPPGLPEREPTVPRAACEEEGCSIEAIEDGICWRHQRIREGERKRLAVPLSWWKGAVEEVSTVGDEWQVKVVGRNGSTFATDELAGEWEQVKVGDFVTVSGDKKSGWVVEIQRERRKNS